MGDDDNASCEEKLDLRAEQFLNFVSATTQRTPRLGEVDEAIRRLEDANPGFVRTNGASRCAYLLRAALVRRAAREGESAATARRTETSDRAATRSHPEEPLGAEAAAIACFLITLRAEERPARMDTLESLLRTAPVREILAHMGEERCQGASRAVLELERRGLVVVCPDRASVYPKLAIF